MPKKSARAKLKTNRGAAKRFKETGSGGFKHRQSHHNHILTKKGGKRIRQLSHLKMVNDSDVAAIRQLLPTG